MSETDSEFLAWAKDRYGSLTGPERDRLFALATRAGFALEAENERLRAEVARLSAENERLRKALKPSVDTKAAYIGEFSFPYTYPGEDGEEVPIKVTVPWTTIKEIMAATRTHAALQDKSDGSGEGKSAIEGEHEASKP